MDVWRRISGTWDWLIGKQRHKNGMAGSGHDPQRFIVPIIATDYGLDGRVSLLGKGKSVSPQRPDRLWCPSSRL
jgi:hypothetical protein